jgi:hypothetical protein
MKSFSLFIASLCIVLACHAQSAPPSNPPGTTAKNPANYLIRVEWTEPKNDPRFLEVLTTEGQFDLNTIQKNSIKINNQDIPITLKFSGTLTAFNDDEGKLQLFLGRTVPYITGTVSYGPTPTSSYSQMNVGLQSAFIVHFGKPETIQTDENGKISVLVKLEED